jgi:two-component system, cell cycle response regulator
MTEARKNQPDPSILGLGRPAGDAFIVMERLKTNVHLAAIPVIIVSARNQRENKARALKARAKAHLQKPVEDDELLAVFRQLPGETVPANAEVVHDQGVPFRQFRPPHPRSRARVSAVDSLT